MKKKPKLKVKGITLVFEVAARKSGCILFSVGVNFKCTKADLASPQFIAGLHYTGDRLLEEFIQTSWKKPPVARRRPRTRTG